ncbi:CotH kinase family protein [Nannocystis sp. ILAH1]|uniref:CotH kinase family protein n=1 Tax=unclassified Nannocystis TaxID=2627009 RepID=UPI002271E663|nr:MULTISPECIES: CotH kinase family protein [unclassified Nannocystis]MCY0988593.1 CotH kinase family protein [Nannocystis sp. ILAH1]MCY1067443.1 CotH kinase family protein [Nannocystis sp. RBIL2]
MTLLAIIAVTGCPASDTASGTGTDGADEDDGTTDPIQPGTGTDATTTTDAPTTTGGGSESTGAMEVTTGTTSTTTGDEPTTTTGDETTGAVDPPPTWAPKACPDIYAQDILPTFEIELAPEELAGLKAEWEAGDDNNTPEHPVKQFKYEDEIITYASIRLRGNATWWPGQGKMQFEIAFNTYDKKGRFRGLKKILFDAAEYNRAFLRDRMAMHIFRDLGLPAPCANNARLMLNGDYYGLFTSIEKVDSEFLERVFELSEGNLYKRGGDWEKKTNEEDPDESDIEALDDAETLADLVPILNIDEAVLEWAAEAVMPDNDGAWAGGLNLYMYNDPKTGFNVIPWDKDATFDRVEPDIDPYTYIKPNDKGRPLYDIVTDDPEWFAKYIEALAHVRATAYDVNVLHARMDAWSAQIEEAALTDVNKPFTNNQYYNGVETMREFIADRAAYLDDWLDCWQNGGEKNGTGPCVQP